MKDKKKKIKKMAEEVRSILNKKPRSLEERAKDSEESREIYDKRIRPLFKK